MLGDSWRLVGFWLAVNVGPTCIESNEQSNVGPTKYVAVGPTLNQRLGVGWRMVSVLAGQAVNKSSFNIDYHFLIADRALFSVFLITFSSFNSAISFKAIASGSSSTLTVRFLGGIG